MEVGTLNSSADLINRYNQNLQITTENTQTNDKDKINGLSTTEDNEEKTSDANQDEEISYDKKALDKAVNKLNKFLEDDKTHAEISYHDRLGTLMVKIIDEETDKIILEVPPKKILDMVASMCEQVGILDKKA